MGGIASVVPLLRNDISTEPLAGEGWDDGEKLNGPIGDQALLNRNQLDFKDKGAVRRNGSSASIAIAQFRRNEKLPL